MTTHEVEIYTDEQISTLMDNVMSTMDKDNNGYISYSEFMNANLPSWEMRPKQQVSHISWCLHVQTLRLTVEWL